MLSLGETAPDWFLGWREGALDCALTGAEGLDIGGRIECFLFAKLEAGRGMPAIIDSTADILTSRASDTCINISEQEILKSKVCKHGR